MNFTSNNLITSKNTHFILRTLVSNSAIYPLVDIYAIPVEITIVLGDTEMKLSELMELGKGSFIELNTYEDNNVKLLANGKLIAYGIVLAIDQNFGIQITKIVD